jgi:cytochrome c oxidase assembly factor CtaG
MVASMPTVWTAWLRLSTWSFDPEVWLGLTFAGVAYWYGRRRLIAREGRAAASPWRAAAFYAALAVTLFALQSPLAWLAGRLLSAHMVHHMLLLIVAAPLFAIATPWAALRCALPPSAQGWVERAGRAADASGPVGWMANIVRHPATAVVVFVATLWLWHLPAAYDLTLRSQEWHETEHLMFLLAGVLFWSHAVGRSWLAARLTAGRRLILLGAGIASAWLLSLVLALQAAPVYAPYVFTTHLVSGLSPLNDQRVAAGLMWAAGMVPFNLAMAMAIKRVLDAEDEVTAAADTREHLP